jgi:hypothetical protein
MTVVEIRRQPPFRASIMRSVVELALGVRLGVGDGARHLCRLTNGQRALIEAALRETACCS